MGDRPGSSSQVRTSEDKVRRKDLCWSVRAVYILEKRPDISRPSLEEVGRYRIVSEPTLTVLQRRVCRSCAGMVRMAGVDPEWSHSMAHALALDTRTWPREDVPSLGLTDEDVGLFRG
jgi:hypothetical protein